MQDPRILDAAIASSVAASEDREGTVQLTPMLTSVRHVDLCNEASLAGSLQCSAPIRYCRSLVPDTHCLHQVGALQIGTTQVISHAGTAAEFMVENSPTLHLVAMHQGQLQLGTATGDVDARGGDALLLPNGLRHCFGTHSLVSISVQPESVQTAAAAMAGLPSLPTSQRRSFELFEPHHLPRGRAAAPIQALMRHIDACHAVDPLLPARLGLDDVIHRAVALLLHPALLGQDPGDLWQHRQGLGQGQFDALIDYIRAHLDQPLRLSDLEARSHYSRRALQYAFQERFGCSPIQWMRLQRLELAMQQLLEAEGPLPIATLALRCGYRNRGAFSVDFRRRYGIAPSQVRRQGH